MLPVLDLWVADGFVGLAAVEGNDPTGICD